MKDLESKVDYIMDFLEKKLPTTIEKNIKTTLYNRPCESRDLQIPRTETEDSTKVGEPTHKDKETEEAAPRSSANMVKTTKRTAPLPPQENGNRNWRETSEIQNRRIIRGTRTEGTNELQSGSTWLYVGRLHHTRNLKPFYP